MAHSRTDRGLDALGSALIRDYFERAYPQGPTQIQSRAWPLVARGKHVLLVAPTGTGKTLAAFLIILDQLFLEHAAGILVPGLRCVYVSPLRSLGYDIEKNLHVPLAALTESAGVPTTPVTVGVRTGDTTSRQRAQLCANPPHILITTPESLALLLSQPRWNTVWKTVEHVIVDEIHSLMPTKRGADLSLSLERLSAFAARDPQRIGLSATCRPGRRVARFLGGVGRRVRVARANEQTASGPLDLEICTLIEPGEGIHRGLSYRRTLRRLRRELAGNRTTIVFANTRALTERITHDLRHERRARDSQERPIVAAHHSALDAGRRRATESALKNGHLQGVITSTSLELGVDIGTADKVIMVGPVGQVLRCLQRVGRAGHQRGAARRGVLMAATSAELAVAAVTERLAVKGRIEPLRWIRAPLDVLCQQLLGMACAQSYTSDAAFELVRRSAPFSTLDRMDFEACLHYLAGDFSTTQRDEGGRRRELRWTSTRLRQEQGSFRVRNGLVRRSLWMNIGTIRSDETVRVIVGDMPVGTLEATFAEQLAPGDRFVLDGRSLEARRLAGSILHARPTADRPQLPHWTSDRQSLSRLLAHTVASFRARAARQLVMRGERAFHAWVRARYRLDANARAVLADLFESQSRLSEIPPLDGVLVEEYPGAFGYIYTFHVSHHRSACEALARATAARAGRRFGRNLSLRVADLGWSIHLNDGDRIPSEAIAELLEPDNFERDVLQGLDRGELLARRFQHVASTALMVLRNPERGRVRVGGMHWVSTRLYPLIKSAQPDHPLLRETSREVLEDLLDTPTARAWLESRPRLRFRSIDAASPFTAAWIDPANAESVAFESPAQVLRRLHEQLQSPCAQHPAIGAGNVCRR